MLSYAVVILLIASSNLLQAAPNGEAVPAAVAAEPAVLAAPSASSAPAVATPAVVAPAPAVATPVRDPAGSGIVTEHKNPDGSTITVTRYNGPLPATAFQNPLAGMTGLHDAFYERNLYQTQLIQLQTQQAINQALLRNYHALNYNLSPAYSLTYPSYFSAAYPAYNFPTTFSLGQGYFPFYGGGYNPFFPFAQPSARIVK
ncbi:hypothetical protein Ocin01_01960 [Orchesella cincta]|uniref:Uncharacterized protein n=1 Tax=Orchesella cincta TaxID=48709 RepID=A0A1D2NHM3_ORCCI|nr:hypothetical protein Ocin01_01960 [Orchesella cincta]